MSRQNFTFLLCSEFVCHVSLKGKALRFLQCVYFWGETKAQGVETYDIFGGQLEEGDAGIRKLAILLLVDWEYFPCVAGERD